MKSTTSPLPTGPQQALIFIPDISGFTQFVSDTEISHSKHIIEELLNTVLDSNAIGLEVSEVEGDAILFYRFGEAPSADELLAQVKKMFIKFHQHLQKYETHRVCNCGACKTAHDLTLKFVAHYGPITINQVQQFKKLFGKDVIVAHRLLKNDIDNHEYALFTHNLTANCPAWSEAENKAWSSLAHSSQEYDSGNITYSYLPMETLKHQLPPLAADDFSLKGYKTKVLESEAVIHAPLEMVFNVISDLPWRSKWIPGALPEVQEINYPLTQSGQTHKCLANGPVIVGHDYKLDTDTITYTETDTQKTYCVVFVMKKLDSTRTRLTATCFLPKNFLKEMMFSIFMKKKFQKVYAQAWNNLDQYCISILENKTDHPYHVQMESSPHLQMASI